MYYGANYKTVLLSENDNIINSPQKWNTPQPHRAYQLISNLPSPPYRPASRTCSLQKRPSARLHESPYLFVSLPTVLKIVSSVLTPIVSAVSLIGPVSKNPLRLSSRFFKKRTRSWKWSFKASTYTLIKLWTLSPTIDRSL